MRTCKYNASEIGFDLQCITCMGGGGVGLTLKLIKLNFAKEPLIITNFAFPWWYNDL